MCECDVCACAHILRSVALLAQANVPADKTARLQLALGSALLGPVGLHAGWRAALSTALVHKGWELARQVAAQAAGLQYYTAAGGPSEFSVLRGGSVALVPLILGDPTGLLWIPRFLG